MKRLLLIAVVALSGAMPFAASARAHDFWIEPANYRPARGETLYLSLRVGQDFIGDAVPRSAQRIESFTVRDASGERAVGGVENIDPAGVITAGTTPAVIGYRSHFSEVELPRAKFETYLKDEGLDNRVNVRQDGVQRERFARFAKTIVGGTIAAQKPFGWRFELVPVSATKFRALYEQKPLPGTLVFALSRDGRQMQSRTDAQGYVTFDLPAGEWLVKTVHMVPAPASSGFQWESLWASITFVR
jgi:uncharacterized GH25 family protein